MPKIRHSTNKFSPELVVDVHTSSKTIGRMQMYEDYWKSDPNCIDRVTPRVILSPEASKSLNNARYYYSIESSISIESRDIRDTANGLVKRVDFATSDFLSAFPNTPWFFRATDDTFLVHRLVLDFIHNASSVYDPFRHAILFATTTNLEGVDYVQGGSGWLLSRAFVEYMYNTGNTLSKYFPYSYFNQDDTTMTIIAKKMFTSRLTWDWLRLIGSPFHEPFEAKSRKCPSGVRVARLNSAMVHHLGLPPKEGVAIFKKAATADDLVFFYHDKDSQQSRLCSSPNESDIEEATPENIKKRAELLEIKDIPNPLFADGELKKFDIRDQKQYYETWKHKLDKKAQ